MKIGLAQLNFHIGNFEENSNKIIDAIEIAKEQKVDLILLDLMMPDRSGFDIYRALQTRLVSMPPVIMLSAVTGMQQRIDARDLGITKYLTKPTTPSKLIETIREVVKLDRKDRPQGKTIDKFPPKQFSG